MSQRFMSMIASATASKEQFDSSMENLKGSLQESIENPSIVASSAAPTTGWLKGSFSYPWVLVCSIAPAIKEIF